MGALRSTAIVRNATCEIGNISDHSDDYYIVYNRDDTQKWILNFFFVMMKCILSKLIQIIKVEINQFLYIIPNGMQYYGVTFSK